MCLVHFKALRMLQEESLAYVVTCARQNEAVAALTAHLGPQLDTRLVPELLMKSHTAASASHTGLLQYAAVMFPVQKQLSQHNRSEHCYLQLAIDYHCCCVEDFCCQHVDDACCQLAEDCRQDRIP